MLDCDQFREVIINATLNDLNMYTVDAAELLIFTCAAQSEGGSYLREGVCNTLRLGIYIMELKTYNDLWTNYIYKSPKIISVLSHNFDVGRMPHEDRLIYDLKYATAMAMLVYQRTKLPFPRHNDVDAIYEFYRTHYNSHEDEAEYMYCVNAYYRFIEAGT